MLADQVDHATGDGCASVVSNIVVWFVVIVGTESITSDAGVLIKFKSVIAPVTPIAFLSNDADNVKPSSAAAAIPTIINITTNNRHSETAFL